VGDSVQPSILGRLDCWVPDIIVFHCITSEARAGRNFSELGASLTGPRWQAVR